MNINFDTQSITKEETDGLIALLNTIAPSRLTTSERQDYIYGSAGCSRSYDVSLPQLSERAVDHTRKAGLSSEIGGATASTEAFDDVVEAPKRERGKPSAGRARRTKEEIAEDEAADQAEAQAALTEAAEPVQNISTGEERLDPQEPAEVQAQDAADEKAEVEAAPAKELTAEDLREVMKAFVDKHGMDKATAEGPKIFAKALEGHALPANATGWSISVVTAAGQEVLAKAYAAWKKEAE